MGELVQGLRDAFNNGKSSVEVGFEIHRSIAMATKNRILVKLLLSIHKELKLARQKLIAIDSKEQLLQELLEHEALYNSIKDRQPEQAREIMRKHLEKAKQTLLSING